MLPNQKTQSKTLEDKRNIASRCQQIIDGLEGNGAWELVLEDFEKQRKRLDDTWQFVKDNDKWYEYRITKLAVNKILTLIDDYKKDMNLATSEIAELENTDNSIIRDVDNT